MVQDLLDGLAQLLTLAKVKELKQCSITVYVISCCCYIHVCAEVISPVKVELILFVCFRYGRFIPEQSIGFYKMIMCFICKALILQLLADKSFQMK